MYDYTKLSQIQEHLESPVYHSLATYEDANEDIYPIAKFITETTTHNDDVEYARIKFLYTSKPIKDGGRYVVGSLLKRSDIEKCVDDRYDFIVILYYPVWKDLDGKNKIIQLDKVLSGIDNGTDEKPTQKKKQADCKEFIENMNCFGANDVLNSSQVVHLAAERIVEEAKEEANKNKPQKGN
jgi:hypothetical protein